MTADAAKRTVGDVTDDEGNRQTLEAALSRGRESAADDIGGDPACWMDRVCPDCGALVDGPDEACPRCGRTLAADGP